MSTLFIGGTVLRGMIADSELCVGECCGFLFGHADATCQMITRSSPVNNATEADKHTNFEISSRDYLNAEREAEQKNMALLGVYHSHPNQSSLPSEYDQAAAQPNFSYIIISVMNQKFAEIRSWRLDASSRLKEEKINLLYTE